MIKVVSVTTLMKPALRDNKDAPTTIDQNSEGAKRYILVIIFLVRINSAAKTSLRRQKWKFLIG